MARAHSPSTSVTPALTAAGHCLFGDSDKVKSICQVVDKVAPHRGPVLLRGESGTGKEVVARAIHMRSPRARRPFVAVNSGAIPQELFESALFGHRKGSFTGALADHAGYFDQAGGGTLFLDEIGDLPLMQQVKLLRVLQSGEIQPVGARESHTVDVRVVAATNRPLERLVESGLFREDLYFRINLFTITLPALRDRTEDIAPLAEAFLRRMATDTDRADLRWAPGALRVLKRYPWPGNIRELENVVQFAVAMAEGAAVTADALPQRVRRGEAPFGHDRHHETLLGTTDGAGGITPLEEVIREHILSVYERCNWNKTHAARALGISLRGLQMKLQRYQEAVPSSGLHRPE